MKGTILVGFITLQLALIGFTIHKEVKAQADTKEALVLAKAEIVKQNKYITKLYKDVLTQCKEVK
jgi:hypothetical protein